MTTVDPLFMIDRLDRNMDIEIWKNVPPPVFHSVKELNTRLKDVRNYVTNTTSSIAIIQKANVNMFRSL